MSELVRPDIEVGRAVKLERGYGREDAVAIAVDNEVGIIDLKIYKSGEIISGVKWRQYAVDDEPYWTELPEGYVVGSEGF